MKIRLLEQAFSIILVASAVTSAYAQAKLGVENSLAEFDEIQMVDESLLAKMRGGFVTPEGIRIDVGVGKASFIDGALQPNNTLNLEHVNFNGHTLSMADLQKITRADLQEISNSVASIIQNSQNNRHIENFTVVDITVKNLPVNFFQNAHESMRNLQDINASHDMQVLR